MINIYVYYLYFYEIEIQIVIISYLTQLIFSSSGIVLLPSGCWSA